MFDDDRRLECVKIGRPTNRHAPRIVVTSGNTVLVFDPKKLAAGTPLWSGRLSSRGAIASLDIADGNRDRKNDIALTTAAGAKVFVDFTGHAVRSSTQFELFPKRGRSRK